MSVLIIRAGRGGGDGLLHTLFIYENVAVELVHQIPGGIVGVLVQTLSVAILIFGVLTNLTSLGVVIGLFLIVV